MAPLMRRRRMGCDFLSSAMTIPLRYRRMVARCTSAVCKIPGKRFPLQRFLLHLCLRIIICQTKRYRWERQQTI